MIIRIQKNVCCKKILTQDMCQAIGVAPHKIPKIPTSIGYEEHERPKAFWVGLPQSDAQTSCVRSSIVSDPAE
jgi:hypothetical protein